MSKKTQSRDIEYEKPLQAILLAESFNDFFTPLTYEMPLALMPLANIPMIDYTIQWLSTQGVKEIFVTFKHFEKQFEEHFKKSHWALKDIDANDHFVDKCGSSPIIYLVPMMNVSCQVDILKEFYERNLLTSDVFLIMTGMSVMNFELKSIIDLHKERYEKDRNNIMTSIFTKASALHPIHRLNSDLAILLNRNTKQILGYSDDIDIYNVPMDNPDIYTCPQIEVHNDLYDTYIDICSTEVLLKLCEINDYKDYHLDFLQDEINNNILGTKYNIHILNNNYAGYVQDIRSYAQINRDILRRWTYPYTPEASFSPENQCIVSDQRIYYNRNIHKDYDTTLGPETLVGSGTELIGNCKLAQCVIGHKNHIEKDCFVENSIVWSHNNIQSGTTIKNSIIANNVSIGIHCTITNCIIGSNVVIGDNVVLTNKKIFRNDLYVPPEDDDVVVQVTDVDLGEGGQGVALTGDFQVDIYDDVIENQRMNVNRNISKELLQGTIGFPKDGLQEIFNNNANNEKRFREGIQEFIEECIYNHADINDTFTQMSCFKMAENKTYEDVLNVTIPIMLNTTDFSLLKTNINDYKRSTHVLFSTYESLIKRNILDDENRLSLIYSLQYYVVDEKPELIPLFGYFLTTFRNLRFINMDTIKRWLANLKSDDPNTSAFLQQHEIKRFSAIINNTEMPESSSDDDSSESESVASSDSESEATSSDSEEESSSESDSEEESSSESDSEEESSSNDSEEEDSSDSDDDDDDDDESSSDNSEDSSSDSGSDKEDDSSEEESSSENSEDEDN